MSHLIFLTKKVGRNQNQGETSQGEMSQGEMSVREKCLLATNFVQCDLTIIVVLLTKVLQWSHHFYQSLSIMGLKEK